VLLPKPDCLSQKSSEAIKTPSRDCMGGPSRFFAYGRVT
jgi:hypothetical protein